MFKNIKRFIKKLKGISFVLFWIINILFVVVLLWESQGDAKIINQSALIRGNTEKLVKQELYGIQNEELMDTIDTMWVDLTKSRREFYLLQTENSSLTNRFTELFETWSDLKIEIYNYHDHESTIDEVYELSQKHFKQADEIVELYQEASSEQFRTTGLIFVLVSLVVLVFIYILEKLAKKKMEHIMNHDPLTKLLSAVGFQAKVKQLVEANPNQDYSIISLDITDFKRINTMYGYKAGDLILCAIAKGLQKTVGITGRSARLVRDNFMIVTATTPSLMSTLEKNVYKAIRNSHILADVGNIRFSYGIYEIKKDSGEANEWIDNAELAKDVAKTNGETNKIWFDSELVHKINQGRYYEKHLEQAIEDRELLLYLQPKYDLKTREIVGAESLVRWLLPTEELVYPNDFIRLFEKNNQIPLLDYYMLEETCRYLGELKKLGKQLFTISVNFSRVTLYDPKFYRRFMGVLAQYGVPYKYIEVEIVETALTQLDKSVIEVLVTLQKAGIQIAMDDFGSGYSNITALCTLPVNIVKLDRCFLLSQNDKMHKIIESVISLSHSLGMKVVCEGIETNDQENLLKSLNCDYGQGYYYARPQRASECDFIDQKGSI